jgi:hypothetical protein
VSSTIAVRVRRLVAIAASVVCAGAAAQADLRPFSKEQIAQLTAQVALFPDALLAQVLMAATYPSDVAAAAAWARANPDEKGDAAVKLVEDQPWDPSVQSLIAFPQVIVMMGENPTWVKDLGDAFLLQPEDVMDSVQRLRAAAQRAGNLESNEHVDVFVETRPPPDVAIDVTAPPPPPQVIVIEQRSPDVIFVPIYNPVTVFGPWMWPAFPPVFIPPPPGFWWSSPVRAGIWWGVGIGVTYSVWGRPNWWNRSVNINIHHHNNIHVRNRIDRGGRDVRWAHDTNRRRDVPYRGGNATRDRLQDRAARIDREQYRGRDLDRQRAQQALRDRGVTTDRAALRDVNRDELRRQSQNVSRDALRDRPQGGFDRDAARDRAASVAARDGAQGIDRGTARDRAQQIDRSAAVNRAQSIDRSRDFQRSPALQGVGDRRAGAEINRGNLSRQSAQQQLQQRQQARPGTARPQVQRPAANTGAARSQAQSARGAAAARAQGARQR